MNNIRLLYIDLFCGAGGTSTGVEEAKSDGKKCAKVNEKSQCFKGWETLVREVLPNYMKGK